MRTINNGFPLTQFNGININTSILSSSANYYSYGSRDVKYVVIHYTGNSSDTAKANANYFSGGSRSASAHYFVDENSCYQSVALNNAAWAVGGTSVYKHADCRNKNSISIEMCCSGNYTVSEQTISNTAYLCAELCKYIGITADTVDTFVLRHYDVWDKQCPAQWATENSAGWTAFKEKVKAILRNEEGLTVSQYEELIEKIKELDNKKADKSEMIYDCIDHNMPEWAHKPVQWCLDNGIVSGADDAHLNLNNTKLWVCVVVYRAVKFVAGLIKIKI